MSPEATACSISARAISPGRPALPMWAAGLLAAAAAMLQLAGQRLDWLAAVLAVGGLAGLLVALPPLMPPGFLRFRPGLPQVVLTRGLLAGAFFGAEAFVPLMLVEQRSVPLFEAGAVLTVGAIGWTVGSWLQSRPWSGPRHGRRSCGSTAARCPGPRPRRQSPPSRSKRR